jgi:type IV pilus assembly protein PilN
MAYINLLPWREAARKEKQKQYVTMLAMTAVFSFLIFFLINMVYSSMIDGQYQRNRYLENEIKILDQKIAEISALDETKRSLQQRMNLIEQLQGSRNLGTEIMSEIARVVPSGIYLTQLEKKGSDLLLIGRSESNNRLSTMLRDSEDSELLSRPLLEFIEAGKDESRLLSNFKMHLTVKGYEAVLDSQPVTPSTRGGAQ